MTKTKSKSNDVHGELRKSAVLKLLRKRSAAIKAVADANAAFEAQWKIWNTPGFLAGFDNELAPGVLVCTAEVLKELEYNLAIELNNLCYIDQELCDGFSSVDIINHTESEWAAREKTAKGKAGGRQRRDLRRHRDIDLQDAFSLRNEGRPNVRHQALGARHG